MPDRYAIYFAPARDSDLWALGASWLGRDAATGWPVPQAIPEGMDPQAFRALTESPRTYGFHATLKPPMRVALGQGFSGLQASAISMSELFAPIDMGPLAVNEIGGFLALTPQDMPIEVGRLAAECVTQFDHLRLPMTDEERQKRLRSNLTERQIELMDTYGYPYVMEEFRFHMTLSNRIEDDEERARLKAAATAHFAPALADPVMLDRICIFHEMEAGAPMMRIADFPLAGRL